ncbi:hypothetical protein SAMN06265795_12927 [Noviherbaspirillum humi]|uniref:Uncharacterized protein n=1 Tax=Noviherbaspirillum humi TaxID=1688639 RepID=A0A239M1C1_9BURK|nr:hypothetical protein [Noviherbaspirillum humi]SNT36330.1 hypothetical protein SAMN06265795_12927 [Noviherbaspirillum humi]
MLAKKTLPLRQKLMMMMLPALAAAGWMAKQLVTEGMPESAAQVKAMQRIDAIESSCLAAAGLQPREREREFTPAEAAALARCGAR